MAATSALQGAISRGGRHLARHRHRADDRNRGPRERPHGIVGPAAGNARTTTSSPAYDPSNADGAGDHGPRPSPGPAWIRRLLPHLRDRRRAVLAAVALACAWTLTVVAVPLLQKVVVDDLVGTGRPIGRWLAALAVVALLRLVTSAAWRWRAGSLGLDVQDDVRQAVYDNLQRLDLSGHSRLQSGQLVSRMSSDLRFVYQMVAWIPLVASSVLKICVATAVMAVLSPPLAIVVVAVLSMVYLVTNHQRSRVYAAGWDSQQREADMTTIVEESVTGVRVVRAFGQEDAETRRLVAALVAMFGSRVRAIRMRAPFIASLQGGPLAGQVLVLLTGGLLVLSGHLTVGVFLAFFAYMADLAATVRGLGIILTTLPQCRSAVERIGEVLDLSPEVRAPDQPVHGERHGGALELRHVSFSYPEGDGHLVLQDVSLVVRPGEIVALVGPSGSGKSSVLTLVPRFADPAAGQVLVDGVDVRMMEPQELRGRIGMVFEDSFLFSDTIAANISYGRPDATPAEVEAASRAAQAHEFICTLDEGYATVVGEHGITLSGGQRQRIALARALLVEPDVLLLDDATSSVDVEVERRIHESLAPLLAGRTVLMVAYRESTLRMADRVLVLEEGRIVAEGTHEELLTRSPRYQALLGDGQGSADAVTARVAAARAGESDVTASAWRSRGDATGHLPNLALQTSPEMAAAVQALPAHRDPVDVDLEAEGRVGGPFRLHRFLASYWRGLAVGLGLVLMEAAATLVVPLLVRHAVDAGMVAGSRSALLASCAAAAGLTAFLWWDQRTGYLWTARTTERMLLALRTRIFGQLQRLGVDYYDRTQAGRVITRMTSDVDALADLLQAGFVGALVSLATFSGMVIVVTVLDWRLALVIVGVVPPAAAVTVWYRRRAVVAYDEARERISQLNSALQEGLAGIRVTHAFRREAENLHRFGVLGAEYVAASRRGLFANGVYIAVIEMLSVSAVLAALALGSRLLVSGTLALGTLLAFLLYLAQVFAPIQQMSQVFDVYQRARAGLVRLVELLGLPTSTPVAARALPVVALRGELALRDVRLRYAGTSTDAIRGLDLSVPPGQRVAFVGRTGAGKSTIAKLVARFYDPTTGQVLADGHDLRELDLSGYRRRLGYVPQEPFLFSRSIRDNIAYGRPSASDAEVEAAARAVGAHDFVVRLPGGYHHHVTERGRSLSAGQRQLLCLARALVVDPAVLILDEATSNLDLASERRVNLAMQVASAGRTTLVVTHRPQSLRWVDRVVVVADGRVIGDHPALDYVAGMTPAGEAGAGVAGAGVTSERGTVKE